MSNKRTLLYYQNIDSLLPADSAVSNIRDKDWYKELKPHFDDLIWEYYSDRVVFVDQRFLLEDDDEDIIAKIKRSFAINLKTRNYEYEKLYDTTQFEYNPIWNVDGVTGTIHERTAEMDEDAVHTGSDTLKNTGYDEMNKTGTDTATKTGTERDQTMDATNGDKTVTHYNNDVHRYVNTYDSAATNPPAEFPEGSEHRGGDDTVNDFHDDQHTYNTTDQMTHNTKDKQEYHSDHETEYDSTLTTGRDEFSQDLDLQIKQGNIGVTKTQELIESERKVVMFDFFKKVVHDCVNTCTYAID